MKLCRKAQEKEIQSLKAQLSEERSQKDNLRFKCVELTAEIEKLRSGESSIQGSEIFPSSINPYSNIAKQVKDIDAEELDEDSSIKIVSLHKGLVQSLNSHLNAIPTQ